MKHTITFAITTLLLLFTFQNCGQFKSQDLQSSSDAGGLSDNNSGLPSPSSTPGPGPAPMPSPSSQSTRNMILLAGAGKISSMRIELATGQAMINSTFAISNLQPGWVSYREADKKVLVPDSVGLRVFGLNADANPTIGPSLTFIDQTAHLEVISIPNGMYAFGSSYGRGQTGMYRLDAAYTASTMVSTVNSGGKTHSSAYDKKRNLLYVASIDQNAISAYEVRDNGLFQVGSISAPRARSVVYDSGYDKLFVQDESLAPDPGTLRIFSVSYVGGAFSSSSVGSVATTAVGSNLALHKALNYVLTLSREAGKETLTAQPLTAEGFLDSTRTVIRYALNQPMPRTIEITTDGQYVVTGSSTAGARTVLLLKINSQNGAITGFSERAVFADTVGVTASGLVPLP